MRYRRLYNKGGSYFITVAIADRKQSLLTKNIDLLRSAILKVKNNNPFTMDAMVILPDHFHMMITLPDNDSDYSQRIGLLKSHFARNIAKEEIISRSRQDKRERAIWQRRFWEHSIRNETDYEMHINYIHYNPVKHGYVQNPSDWQYSSIHRYIKANLLSPNWSSHP